MERPPQGQIVRQIIRRLISQGADTDRPLFVSRADHRMTGWIGIALGDITGIGAEVALKALAAEISADETRYLLLGDEARLRCLNDQLHAGLQLVPNRGSRDPGRIFIHDPASEPLPVTLQQGGPAAAFAALAWLADGAQRCLRHELDALVTAPVNKEAIIRAGRASFVGQTEFLSELAGTNRTAMMLLGADERDRWLRVALATTHVPIRRVADQLSREKIELTIELTAQACHDLGLPRARVGVCGLNPHAGEGGQLGTEGQTIIIPAVNAARDRVIAVTGPLP